MKIIFLLKQLKTQQKIKKISIFNSSNTRVLQIKKTKTKWITK